MNAKPSYRPDIDGLRAIAVLLVLLFHAGTPGFGGGFVGVDVFFVLTGFLITGLLEREIKAGVFSFANFYNRRIRRLLPALVIVLLATTIAAFVILLPEELNGYLGSLRFALVSGTNFYFLFTSGGYFDVDIHELPLLHTWSLAVEEQFYLLWPAVFFLMSRKLSPSSRMKVLIYSTIVSLLASQLTANNNPEFAYYMLPSRAFEILSGAILALHIDRLQELSVKIRSGFSFLGALLILAPALSYSSETPFPGFYAFIPCLGTLLLIISGSGSTPLGIVNRILCLKPLVVVGLLSYSIYLWHWPIIAFINAQGIGIEGVVAWAVVISPVLLAGISYVFVERPFRYKTNFKFRTSLIGLVILPAIIGFILYAVSVSNNGFPGRFAGDIATLGGGSKPPAPFGNCKVDKDISDYKDCLVGNSGEIDGLLIGDSYAGMYVQFVDVLAKDAGMSFRHLWWSLSPPIGNVSVQRNKPNPDSLRYNTQRQNLAKKFKYVVFISSWGGYHDTNRNRVWDKNGKDVSAHGDDLHIQSIDDFVKLGIKVIVVDRPLARPGNQLIRRIRASKAAGEPASKWRLPPEKRPDDYVIKRIEKKYSSKEVLIIRPWDVLCDNDVCDVDVDGTLLFSKDGSHLNHNVARLLGKKFLLKKGNPLKGF